jgi:ABC-2 type transport system ATP-binding protein
MEAGADATAIPEGKLAGKPVIELKRFVKHYGDVEAVKGIDLTVHQGEVFGFLGPNGAGKTTTIRVMLDYIRRTDGEVWVLGMDSHDSTKDIRSRIGYLPGEFGLYEGLTVENFLLYLLDVRGVPEKEPRMRELAKYFDMELDRKIRELSKGNRQKVGLVQAFMHDPELVILDEPTAGLDPLMQQKFYKMIAEEKENGRTVFLSSHVLAEVEHICDRVAIINEGKIVMVDSIDALKESVGKVLTVTFQETVPRTDLEIEGITDLKGDGRTYKMTVRGDIDAVIKRVAAHSIQSMTVETYSLEELFLEMYNNLDVEGGDEA